jgi:hypothetical protein
MPSARDIIQGALRFRLNRLSPGETADPDTLAVCVEALNNIVDRWNGLGGLLFREVLAQGNVTGSGTLGTTWPTVAPGAQILGATVNAGGDVPLDPLTVEQYHEAIAIKATSGTPQFYAHDGAATVYFYPQPVAQAITLRVHEAVSAFDTSNLDAFYIMPAGYKSALIDNLAELLAPTMNPAVLGVCKRDAAAARARIGAAAIEPAILGTPRRGSILTGWN